MPAPLTPAQRRYLSRIVCAWCDQPFDRPDCGALYATGCTEATRAERRARYLQGFKPRGPRKPTPGSSNGPR